MEGKSEASETAKVNFNEDAFMLNEEATDLDETWKNNLKCQHSSFLSNYQPTDAVAENVNVKVYWNKDEFILKEEAIDLDETCKNNLKYQHPSPLSKYKPSNAVHESVNVKTEDFVKTEEFTGTIPMRTEDQTEDFVNTEEFTGNIPIETEYQTEDFVNTEEFTGNIPIETEYQELLIGNCQESYIEHHTWNCLPSSSQLFRVEVKAEKRREPFLGNSIPSVHEAVVMSSPETIKPCAVASSSTTEVYMSQEEFAANLCASKGHEQQIAGLIQLQSLENSNIMISGNSEEIPFQGVTPRPGLLRSPMEERSYMCVQCGKTFETEMHLNNHEIITHKKECHECGKSFTKASSLKRHMLIHTRDQPYQCYQCGRCFTQNGTLTNHMRIHAGEKPYKCSTCGRSFRQSGTCTDHMRLHSEEKPYKCPQCGESFKQSRQRIRHMRKHKSDCSYQCQSCGECFMYSSLLSEHQCRFHPRGSYDS